MKQRILYGWNFQRVLFLFMGILILVQSVMAHEWPGMLIGGYFATMGIFSLGCAGGNCAGNACDIKPETKTKETT